MGGGGGSIFHSYLIQSNAGNARTQQKHPVSAGGDDSQIIPDLKDVKIFNII